MLYTKIRRLAAVKNVSIYRLELETGVGKNVVHRWNERMPSADKLAKVAAYLDTTVEDLLKNEEVDSVD